MSNPACRICGRELDDCGTCACIKEPLGRFLRYAVDTCVNPERESQGLDRDVVDMNERESIPTVTGQGLLSGRGHRQGSLPASPPATPHLGATSRGTAEATKPGDCMACGHSKGIHDTGWDAAGCMVLTCFCRSYVEPRQ